MRVAGFDPGLDVTGWALIERDGLRTRVVWTGTIRTTAGEPQQERLRVIAAGIAEVLRRTLPDLVGVEAYTYQGPRTGHAPSLVLPRIVERALATAEAFGVRAVEVPRSRICSMLTGRVNAPKAAVHASTAIAVGLGASPRDLGRTLDERDAVGVALVGAMVDARGTMGRAAPRGRPSPAQKVQGLP